MSRTPKPTPEQIAPLDSPDVASTPPEPGERVAPRARRPKVRPAVEIYRVDIVTGTDGLRVYARNVPEFALDACVRHAFFDTAAAFVWCFSMRRRTYTGDCFRREFLRPSFMEPRH